MQIPEGKYIYFASDFHLGAPNFEQSLIREKKVVAWLSEIKDSCHSLFLVGDVFDFWFDYGSVVPAGHSRLIAKLAEFNDSGIPINFFTGNHDMWVFNYLQKETGIEIFREKLALKINDKNFLIAHGDGLGPNDHNYKRLKKVFSNSICQFLFKWLHPNIGTYIARKWSMHDLSQYNGKTMEFFKEEEWLVKYARKKLETEAVDYFIFGHRHIPLIYPLSEKSKMVLLGDWINHFTFAKLSSNSKMELLSYE